MKLYTEEQVRDILIDFTTPMGVEYYLSKLTPIELPSGEEIEAGRDKTLFVSSNPEHKMFNVGTRAGFINGAKWVIEQIKQQGNGN